VTLSEEDVVNSGEGKASPDPPPPEQTPFQKFEEFARRVISVPKSEIERRERTYRETKESEKPRPT
jgi:hypothetical protein